MRFNYTDSVDVLSPREVKSKYSNDLTYSWSDPIRRRVDGVVIYPGVTEERPSLSTPYRLDDEYTAIFPYGDPIRSTDRVEVITGIFAGTYTVHGTPAHWRTPWSGWEACTEVRLKESTGG